VTATAATIADGSYPGSRPLFIYVKKQHVGVIPGLQQYLNAFITAAAPGGALAERGLIPLSADLYAQNQAVVRDLPVLTAADLN
jgi:phosphate transport system substrate-binding protein